MTYRIVLGLKIVNYSMLSYWFDPFTIVFFLLHIFLQNHATQVSRCPFDVFVYVNDRVSALSVSLLANVIVRQQFY